MLIWKIIYLEIVELKQDKMEEISVKKKIISLIIISTILMGCSANEATEANTKEPETVVTVMSMDDTASTVQEEPSAEPLAETIERTQESIEEAWEARLDNTGDYSTELPELNSEIIRDEILYNDTTPILSVVGYKMNISGEGYELLSENVEAVVNNDIDEFASCIDEYYDELVAENFDDNLVLERRQGFGYPRVDNRIFCMSECSVAKNSQHKYYCFDSLTGEQLKLEDIIVDLDTFWDIAIPEIRAKRVLERPAINDEIRAVINSMDTSEEGWAWYLNTTGIVFVLYDVSTYYITLPYKDYADLINVKYLPGDGPIFGEIAINEITQFNDDYDISILDGSESNQIEGKPAIIVNGTEELIFVSDERVEEEAQYGGDISYDAAYVMVRNDGETYLFLYCHGTMDGSDFGQLLHVVNEIPYLVLEYDEPSANSTSQTENGVAFYNDRYSWDSTEEW